MYRLATVDRVTDRRRARKTDNVIVPIADNAAISGSAKKDRKGQIQKVTRGLYFSNIGSTFFDRFTPQVAPL